MPKLYIKYNVVSKPLDNNEGIEDVIIIQSINKTYPMGLSFNVLVIDSIGFMNTTIKLLNEEYPNMELYFHKDLLLKSL